MNSSFFPEEKKLPSLSPAEQQIEDFLDGNWDNFLHTLGDTLFSMKTTDFDPKNGLNECGFKCIIISYLNTLMSMCGESFQCDIESEKVLLSTIDGQQWGFVDIVVSHKPTHRQVVLELKYVRMEYLWSSKNKPLVEETGCPKNRKSLHENSQRMFNISGYEASTLLYNPYNSNVLKPISSLCEEALEQAMRYCESLPKNRTTIVGGIVGYGSWVQCFQKNNLDK